MKLLTPCFMATTMLVSALHAQNAPSKWGDWPKWGDQKDGTYRNPVLPGDYSDLDCIRVGSDYYAISSSFQYSPGMVILHSKDLVNWTIVGHAIDDVTQISPRFNWDRMNGYARGVWAGAIRYHDGKFWVYFGTPDEGYFMTTAKDPAGPWEPLHQMTKTGGWDDCCPFWDDDGQGYFVGTSFGSGYKTWLYKLTPDGRDIVPDSGVVINEGAHREANKLFKVGDTYYHFYSEVGDGGRYVMMQRAKSITGPYTEKHRLSNTQSEFHEPNQGGIVQTEKGDWYFLTHHGHGDWEGRPASLLPVTWVDGWPILGKVGDDGVGTMVWGGEKPVKNMPAVVPQSSDDFNGPKLGLQWEWNFQPRKEKWSLAERPGFLRLCEPVPLAPLPQPNGKRLRFDHRLTLGRQFHPLRVHRHTQSAYNLGKRRLLWNVLLLLPALNGPKRAAQRDGGLPLREPMPRPPACQLGSKLRSRHLHIHQ
jgi:beta-xylosidase